MIEILLTNLSKSDFYEETLKTIEQICDEYAIGEHFGTLSMANQMVCDYLESQPRFDVDVAFRIENDGVSFHYILQNGVFRHFSESESQDNTGFFVLKTLADEVSFSTDFDTLTTTFHVKTKVVIKRNVRLHEVRKNVFNF